MPDNALTAIARLPYGKMTALDGVAQLMEDIVAEALAVAQAEHILIGTASLSILCRSPAHPEVRVLALWNSTPGRFANSV